MSQATNAQLKRDARIARYKGAYLAANGHPVAVHYDSRRYVIGSGIGASRMDGPALDRAADRLLAYAKAAQS